MKTCVEGFGGCSSIVEHLLSMSEALGSIPNVAKQNQKPVSTLVPLAESLGHAHLRSISCPSNTREISKRLLGPDLLELNWKSVANYYAVP